MARPIRVQFPDAAYHVLARGNERKAIFRTDQDRLIFLKTLAQMIEQFGVQLYAYCLMPNHYHLLLQTPRANLSRAMGWFQTAYTIRYNRRYKRTGHLFQGRFKAHLIEADSYARQLVCYIHLNPVRPRDKRAPIPSQRHREIETYPWSSHLDYAGRRDSPPWLNLEWLSYWASTKPKARQEYRKDIQQAFVQTVYPWDQLRGGLVLGGERLWETAKNLIHDKQGEDEIRWKQRQKAHEIRKRVESVLSQQPDKRIQMWARVRIGGEKITDVAHEFGYNHGSGIWQVIQRLEAQAKKEEAMRKKLIGLRQTCEV